ncbi:hypothetical protein C0Q70_06815 [Pomacea canaliculata]|uniref:Uncharacterized protein n=1 Tax=Pomacea canaliculata TaxID=400727 RepID=A0A2T7PDA6_POMCA|nr:hypothetical protein C0Q70_06815 [Pomacea canaliculata]
MDEPEGSSATDSGCGANFEPYINRGTFTPFQKLQVNDLPAGWRHQETLDVIRRVAQRVVRIRVPFLSVHRPISIYSDKRNFGGTGFAYYVDHQVVKVRTNMHVIFNKEEAGASIIDFFLDLPDRKRPKRIEIRGSMHDFDWSISEDYASITCAPTAKLLQYMNLFTDIPILWETSFFSNDKPHVDRAALSTSAQHATTTENVDRAHHPETGASHFKDACYWAGIDRSVSACALQPEDYVVLISHPDGGEKCFSVGHAIVYPCAGVTAHTRASKHCSDPAVNQNSTWASSRLEGQPTWLTFLKRVAMNLDRYYSTQSMNGCSGAPILILKHSLRHLRMPILDTSQHSGSVCFEKGFSIGYATAFMPSMFGSSRCPDRVSEEALPHFQAAAQNGDWSPDSISDSFSTRRVRSSSSKLKTPWRRGITGLSATSRDRPPSCDISTTGRQGKDEQVHRSSECRARNGARMLKTKLGMKPSTRKTASSTSKRQEAEYISRLLSLRETVTLTTPHCFRKNYIQQRREAGWKADANNLRSTFPFLTHNQHLPTQLPSQCGRTDC